MNQSTPFDQEASNISPAGKGLTSWRSYVMSYCEFVTFPLVSSVRCDT